MARFDDEYDRPRRSKKKKKAATPGWPIYVGAGIALVVCCAVAVVVLMLGRTGGSKPDLANAAVVPGTPAPGKIESPATPAASPAPAPANVPAPAVGGVVYEPRVSEAKLTEYLKQKGKEVRLTDDEVFAIMGKPTRTELYFDGIRKGEKLYIYHAYWEVPGSGIKSQITFANKITSGMIIGLEVSPKK